MVIVLLNPFAFTFYYYKPQNTHILCFVLLQKNFYLFNILKNTVPEAALFVDVTHIYVFSWQDTLFSPLSAVSLTDCRIDAKPDRVFPVSAMK